MGRDNLITQIKKHPRLRFILQNIKEINNHEYINDVIALKEDPFLFRIRRLGNKNEKYNIYCIYIGGNKCASGFCAIYKTVLEYLYYARQFHFEPVICFDRNVLYAEPGNFKGTDNAFEYYFEQPGKVTLKESMESKNVIFSNERHIKLFSERTGYLLTEEQIDELAVINRKYIQFKPEIKEILVKSGDGLLQNKKTLGVHIRGTDFKENYNSHPVYIGVEEYIALIKEILAEKKFEQIFLATDEMKILQRFREAFGQKVIFHEDILRSADGKPIHTNRHGRENDRFLLGMEILKDVYTLSSCQGLVAGNSNVSICARIINKSLSACDNYTYIQILDKGVNKNYKKFGMHHVKNKKT